MKTNLTALVTLLLVLFQFPITALANPTPKQLVQATVDELVEVVKEYPGENQATERRSSMRTVIEPLFDFEEMAKRSLGPHWKTAEETERAEFVEIFSDLLATTYLNKIEKIGEGTVAVDSEKIRSSNALVRTTVTYKGDEFPLDYKMLKRGNGWRVYDVVIENIGLVKNYRNEFSGIIRREQFSGLLKRLKTKTTS